MDRSEAAADLPPILCFCSLFNDRLQKLAAILFIATGPEVQEDEGGDRFFGHLSERGGLPVSV